MKDISFFLIYRYYWLLMPSIN